MDAFSHATFNQLKVLPKVAIICAYIQVKAFYLIFEIIVLLRRQRLVKAHPNYSISCVVAVCSGVVCGCCYCCFCCCNCCHKEPGRWTSSQSKWIHLITKFNRYVVKTFLGPGEGLVKKAAIHKNDFEEEDEYGVPKLFIRDKELSHREISNFSLIIFIFGLLALANLWDSLLQESTMNICSIEHNRYCFPIITSTDYSMDVDIRPITNCSHWNSEDISNLVTFQCYQWMFTFTDKVASIGGLLTIFVLVVKVIFSTALSVIDQVVEKCVRSPSEEPSHFKVKLVTLVGFIRLGRTVLALILYCAEVVIAIMGTRTDFIVGSEIVLVFGVATSGLLLPLEEYALTTESPKLCQQHEQSDQQPNFDTIKSSTCDSSKSVA